jgi:hypothetical protein
MSESTDILLYHLMDDIEGDCEVNHAKLSATVFKSIEGVAAWIMSNDSTPKHIIPKNFTQIGIDVYNKKLVKYEITIYDGAKEYYISRSVLTQEPSNEIKNRIIPPRIDYKMPIIWNQFTNRVVDKEEWDKLIEVLYKLEDKFNMPIMDKIAL